MSKKITIEKAEKLIKSTQGAVFSVQFRKTDGTVRDMTCRLGVTKHLKGGVQAYNPKDFDMLTVFDMQKQGYRMIRLNTLQRVKVGGVSYRVVQ